MTEEAKTRKRRRQVKDRGEGGGDKKKEKGKRANERFINKGVKRMERTRRDRVMEGQMEVKEEDRYSEMEVRKMRFNKERIGVWTK